MIKSLVYILAFAVYMPLFYGEIHFAFFVSELFFYLFLINFMMYGYYYYINKSQILKTKNIVIYGAGKAGLKLEEEFRDSEYKVKCFVDDSEILHQRSIDGIKIISKENLKKKLRNENCDLLVIAMPSASKKRIKELYERLGDYFKEIKILPAIDEVLKDKPFSNQLKKLTVRDLLARDVKDLDKSVVSSFIKDRKVLITGAAGSIGSELVRQCIKFEASEIILLDHSEFGIYTLLNELHDSPVKLTPLVMSVTNRKLLSHSVASHKPDIVIHAAAYKHVPLMEENIEQAVLNNVIGTKNVIDISIENGVDKFLLISTDKAVRPTNVMGTTKRICELYMQNVDTKNTSVAAVRFGNVLGSSGSVIPRFQALIAEGKDLTVTDPEMTRYFMLIPEACELVLQAASLGKGGEIFILDMGAPIKIHDLAKKMIELSGREDIDIIFTGLRPGEKLYEELLIDESDMHTAYDSITVAAPTPYGIDQLNEDIDRLLKSEEKLVNLKKIVPEFDHHLN